MINAISIENALRLIDLALADCDKPADRFAHCGNCGISLPVDDDFDALECDNRDSIGSPCGGTFTLTLVPTMEFSEDGEAFIVLARATMRPMLELVAHSVARWYHPEGFIESGEALYPSLAALRDHYDAVRPDWRER